MRLSVWAVVGTRRTWEVKRRGRTGGEVRMWSERGGREEEAREIRNEI